MEGLGRPLPGVVVSLGEIPLVGGKMEPTGGCGQRSGPGWNVVWGEMSENCDCCAFDLV